MCDMYGEIQAGERNLRAELRSDAYFPLEMYQGLVQKAGGGQYGENVSSMSVSD